jgi:RNA polymerase sigma-70 factor (ECF subfamily)
MTVLPEQDFGELVRQHQAMVFSIAYHLLQDRAAAEDVAQEVFLQLHRSIATMKSPEHILFWLRKTSVHRAIDLSRKRVHHANLDDVPEPVAEPERSDPLLSARLRHMVASLPEKSRAVMVLRYQEDLEPEEIARVLGMPLNTVKSHLQRSLAMMRDKLTRVLGEYAHESL